MILRGRDLSTFELRVAGYQFPELDYDLWDSNWLMVEIEAAPVDERPWVAADPSLLTWEVERLSLWLDALASRLSVEDEEDFVEPNLRFEVIARENGTFILRVYFELELRPPWFFADAAGMDDLWMDLEVDSDDLRVAAEDLRRDLDRYPPRAGGTP